MCYATKDKIREKYNDIFDWNLDLECIKEDIKEKQEEIKYLKYQLELLKERKPKTKFKINWNLIKCFFGNHVWEIEDNGYMRTCLRCNQVERREPLAPDGDLGPWHIWRG